MVFCSFLTEVIMPHSDAERADIVHRCQCEYAAAVERWDMSPTELASLRESMACRYNDPVLQDAIRQACLEADRTLAMDACR